MRARVAPIPTQPRLTFARALYSPRSARSPARRRRPARARRRRPSASASRAGQRAAHAGQPAAVEHRALEPRLAQLDLGQVAALEARAAQVGAGEVGAGEQAVAEDRALDPGGAEADEVGAAVREQDVAAGRVAQVEAGQPAAVQLDGVPLAVGRLDVGEAALAQPRVAQRPARQPRAGQLDLLELHVAQLDALGLQPAQVGRLPGLVLVANMRLHRAESRIGRRGPPAPPARPPAAREVAEDAARGRGLGLRAEVGRLPLDRVRRRRRGPPAVAQRQAAHALLPGARRSPRGATSSTARSCCFDERGRQDFDALGQRIHPAKSRIDMLAETTPTRFIAFDLLAVDDESLLELPQRERRARLEQLIEAPVDLTPASEDPAEAQPWLQHAEGVIAKRQEAPYRPGERVGMVKIKRLRTIDAVVQGWRPGKEEGTRRLAQPRALRRRTGACATSATRSGFTAKQKRELPAFLAPYETGERYARRAEPLERLARAQRRRAAARAGRGSDLRPHQQRAHPPRREDPALARGQGPARLHAWSSSTSNFLIPIGFC